MVQSIFEMVQWYNGTLCTALNVYPYGNSLLAHLNMLTFFLTWLTLL